MLAVLRGYHVHIKSADHCFQTINTVVTTRTISSTFTSLAVQGVYTYVSPSASRNLDLTKTMDRSQNTPTQPSP